MLFSLNSLNKYIQLNDTPKHIGKQLTLKSCEIEEVHTRIIPEGVVLGFVTEVKDHPNSKKLKVCQCDCGSKGMFQICTAAVNITENYYVPIALPGTHLPTLDLTIGKRELGGEESNGMVCAKSELGINEDEDIYGIWNIQHEDKVSLTPLNKACDYNTLEKADVGKPLTEISPWLENSIFDVDNKTLTHRPDMTGHFGIAQELNAIYQTHFSDKINTNNLKNFHQTLENKQERTSQGIQSQTDKLRCYSTITLSNITIAPSSLQTRVNMIDLGLAPRNNRVDLSNIFMYETSQPIHFFDSDKIEGDIIIRQATQGEEFTDLFDKKHNLTPEDMVITDKNGILALAGIIGGKESGVTDETKNITVEIANFDPIAVRRTALRIGVRTDASTRFEKNINPAYSYAVLEVFKNMLEEKINNNQDSLSCEIKETNSYLSPERANKNKEEINMDLKQIDDIVGTELPSKAILTELGFECKEDSVIVPSRRGPSCTNIRQDVSEEVVRIYGYEKIPTSSIMQTISANPHTPDIQLQQTIENIITQKYNCDIVENYPRAHQTELKQFDVDTTLLPTMQNSLSPETAQLSNSLLYNLFSLIKKNSKFFDTLRIGTSNNVRTKKQSTQVFNKIYGSINTSNTHDQETFIESRHYAFMLYEKNPSSDRTKDSSLEAKKIIRDIITQTLNNSTCSFEASNAKYFHPKKQAIVSFENQAIGFIGSIHPTLIKSSKLPEKANAVYAYIDLAKLREIKEKQAKTVEQRNYSTLSDQILLRDFSFVLDKTSSFDTLLETIKNTEGVENYTIFDIYEGERLPEDKKSIALQISIKGDGKMKTEQINAIMDECINNAKKTGAILRKDFDAQS